MTPLNRFSGRFCIGILCCSILTALSSHQAAISSWRRYLSEAQAARIDTALQVLSLSLSFSLSLSLSLAHALTHSHWHVLQVLGARGVSVFGSSGDGGRCATSVPLPVIFL